MTRCKMSKKQEKKGTRHHGAARLHASVEVLKLKRQRCGLEISDFDINKFIQFVLGSMSLSLSISISISQFHIYSHSRLEVEGPSLASRVEQRRGSDREILRSKFPLARFGRVTGDRSLGHLTTSSNQKFTKTRGAATILWRYKYDNTV